MIKKNKITVAIMTAVITAALGLTACSSEDVTSVLSTTIGQDTTESSNSGDVNEAENPGQDQGQEPAGEGQMQMGGESSTSVSGTPGEATQLLDTADMFTERDLEQEADLTDATNITLSDGEDVNITSEGVYVISGTASEVSIIVEVADTEKVQIVLDDVNITNTDSPAIYVKSADKVFVTTTDSDNTLKVTGTFTADGTTNTDAVIFSKDDLVLNGKGSLTISSTANGISCKDDLKITGGTYDITSSEDAIEANDSIRISDGTFKINSSKDAIHSENSDDDTVGFVYISGGSFDIEAGDDGIQATTVLMIDGGTIDITAVEGMEGTFIQINDGIINVSASDDGINASTKSSAYDVCIEVNGGDITVEMGSGDTDGFDSNGDIIINGGTISVTGNSAFDWDGEAQLNGGTVTFNGEEVTELTNQFGGGMGGFGGGPGGQNGQNGQGGFGGDQNGAPSGQAPDGTDGQMPQMPDGQAPDGSNGQMPTPPDGGNGGNGQMQGGPQGGKGQH